jgi:hypothetical protein
MNASNKSFSLIAALTLLAIPAATGCVASSDDVEIDEIEMTEADDLAPKAWTGFTSEENPPLECSAGTLVRGAECQGSYCDNIRIDCVSAAGTYGQSSWTSYFSEEGTNSRTCPSGEWVTGIACQGRYCDNIALECTEVIGSSAGSCSWTSAYSEEDGPYQAGSGRFVRGVRCTGRYCDNLAYYVCTKL